MNVELIYDRACPNVADARSQLLKAFAQTGRTARWSEWDRADPSSPPHTQRYGSPTILVDGVDVAGEQPRDNADCCRLYRDVDHALRGVPSATQIVQAMHRATMSASAGKSGAADWKAALATIPGIVIAFLPNLTCPACWPAYAGLLSAVGLGVLLDTAYLFPLTAALLLVAVAALATGARRRHGFRPFALGLIAASAVMIGKFVFLSDAAMYGGIVMLVAASIWNTWPRSATATDVGVCAKYAPAVQAPHSKKSGADEVSR